MRCKSCSGEGEVEEGKGNAGDIVGKRPCRTCRGMGMVGHTDTGGFWAYAEGSEMEVSLHVGR